MNDTFDLFYGKRTIFVKMRKFTLVFIPVALAELSEDCKVYVIFETQYVELNP